MQVGRALRSEHACARPAYPCDPLGLRSTRRKRLGHLAVSPCVHRSMLLLLVEQSSSSTRHRCLHRSRAPALWSQYTILGGSDAFSRRCARWCAEHFTNLPHFGARALCVCLWLVSCRCDSIDACGTSNARPRQPCGASSWSWAVPMRSCGGARDGVCFLYTKAEASTRRIESHHNSVRERSGSTQGAYVPSTRNRARTVTGLRTLPPRGCYTLLDVL